MVTASEIADYDTEELERQLGDTRRELFNLRFQLATGQLDNFSRLNHVRKDVARMLTELRNREIAEAEGMAIEELPAHVAAARRHAEDEALGRDQTTASERRAAAKAAEAGPATDDVDDTDDGVDQDELAEEVADDDGMAPVDTEDAPVGDSVDEDEDEDEAEDGPEEKS
jgi:large subunit ribosomal protein L29